MLNRSALRELQKHKKAVGDFFASLPVPKEEEGSHSQTRAEAKDAEEDRGVDNRPAWVTEGEKEKEKENENEKEKEGKVGEGSGGEEEKTSEKDKEEGSAQPAAATTTAPAPASEKKNVGYGLLTIERHTATRGGLAQSHALIEMIPVPPISALPEKERRALRELCSSAESLPGMDGEEEGEQKDHVAAAFVAAGRRMNITFEAIPSGTTLAQVREVSLASSFLPPDSAPCSLLDRARY